MDMIFSSTLKEKSSWYTVGGFSPGQVGGIALSDENDNILDIDIVPSFDSKYKLYKKLIGVLRVGPKEFKEFKKYLASEVKISTMQYYLTPWINNLSALPCKSTSLSNSFSGSFNTPEDYYETLAIFKDK